MQNYSQLCHIKNSATLIMLNNTQTYSDMWQNCLDRIKAQTSEEEFVKWFQPIVPLEFAGTDLRQRVPNESYVHQIEKNYIPFLRPIISQLYGQQTRLHYAVPRSTPPAVPVTADADTTAISRFNTQTNTANIKTFSIRYSKISEYLSCYKTLFYKYIDFILHTIYNKCIIVGNTKRDSSKLHCNKKYFKISFLSLHKTILIMKL